MVILIIVQFLLLILQVVTGIICYKTGNDFWLLVSNILFACVIGIMVYILMSYGLA